MSHDKHTDSNFNKDLLVDVDVEGGYVSTMSREKAREYYLNLLRDYESPYPDPVVRLHEGVRVVRDDLIVGTKARAADPVVWKSKSERFVYCQPRVGLAGVALLDVANRRDRSVTLFMPACREISEHQAVCIERGADPQFRRIAAMPNLNKYAREWAKKDESEFVPLGLVHPLATAGIVLAASRIPEPPDVVFVAMSTGVLCRALQIAWPKTEFYGIAVARNIKEGEKGEATIISEPLSFSSRERHVLPPFPSVDTYDSKVWKWVPKNSDRDILFWNVGTDPILRDKDLPGQVKSDVSWEKKSTLLDV